MGEKERAKALCCQQKQEAEQLACKPTERQRRVPSCTAHIDWPGLCKACLKADGQAVNVGPHLRMLGVNDSTDYKVQVSTNARLGARTSGFLQADRWQDFIPCALYVHRQEDPQQGCSDEAQRHQPARGEPFWCLCAIWYAGASLGPIGGTS